MGPVRQMLKAQMGGGAPPPPPLAAAPLPAAVAVPGWKDAFKPLAEIITTKVGGKFLVRKAKSDLPLICKSEMGAGINKGYMPAAFDQAVADEFVNVFLIPWIKDKFGDIKKVCAGVCVGAARAPSPPHGGAPHWQAST